MITINREDPTPFYRQIHRQVVRGIEAGQYRTGDRLPSIRPFAHELGVSRNTVEQAYFLLTQEGYVSSRQGSGYFVSHIAKPRQGDSAFSKDFRQALAVLQAHDRSETAAVPRFDFAPDGIEPNMFPFYRWARISRDVMLDEGRTDACKPMDPRGLLALRKQISRYLAREQDIIALPEQIAIFPSAGHAIASAMRLLAEAGFTAIFEDPCRPEVVAGIRESGISAMGSHPSPKEHGGAMLWANHTHPQVVCAAPANRYPLNIVMPLEERKRLVSWAGETNSYLLEYGYCQEFLYGSPRLPSLHSLDAEGRVITVGSFAESLSPCMGLAYVTLPPLLMSRWLKSHQLAGNVPWQLQATFAEFMQQDLWTSHLRRLQTNLGRKRNALANAVHIHFGDAVTCIEQPSSLHTLLRVMDGRSESELVARAAQRSVRVYPTSRAWTSAPPAGWNCVIAGYARIPFEDIEPGIAALAQAWLR